VGGEGGGVGGGGWGGGGGGGGCGGGGGGGWAWSGGGGVLKGPLLVPHGLDGLQNEKGKKKKWKTRLTPRQLNVSLRRDLSNRGKKKIAP